MRARILRKTEDLGEDNAKRSTIAVAVSGELAK